VRLLALWVVAALFLLMLAPSAGPVYAQSTSAGGNASQSASSGKTSKTGSTSKQQ
jgi:hypothetical protein